MLLGKNSRRFYKSSNEKKASSLGIVRAEFLWIYGILYGYAFNCKFHGYIIIRKFYLFICFLNFRRLLYLRGKSKHQHEN